MSFEVSIQVPDKLVRDVLINGLETTRWCGVRNYDYRFVERWFEHPSEPLEVYDHYEDDQPMDLTKKKLRRGLQLMAEKHPTHFSDLQKEDYDAITSDVLLQLSLFGELIYG